MPSSKILIVDDEADLKNVLKRGLEMTGFQVSTECDPLEALANFKGGEYGLIISDIRMPKMDGFELVDKLSKIDPGVKVCFLTAFDIEYFEKFKQQFPSVPTRCFIKKPISIVAMIGAVKAELDFTTSA